MKKETKMQSGNLKISIDKQITEQKLIEDCIARATTGYEYSFLLTMYSFAEKWHIDKLTYYINLIEKARK